MLTLTGPMPELKGDGRYRVYTVDVLPFDALPDYRDGGPARVVVDGWGKSTSSLSRAFSSASVVAADDRMHTLSLYRANSGPVDAWERHPLDGTKYPTARDADRAAYEAGCTGFMVYEKAAARWGLPTADAL